MFWRSKTDETHRLARAEAAAWLARLRADDRSQEDENAFREWLAAGPAHATAFEAIDQTWSIIGSLPINMRTGQLEVMSKPSHRRAVLAGLAATFASGACFSFWRSASANVYQTDVGEQKHVALPDSSQLFLDTDTCVAVDYTDAVRSVGIRYGRVNFQVVPDKKRPFVVEAAARTIVAVNSNFDVYCQDQNVEVVLVRGKAAIRSKSVSQPSETLNPGERLIAAPESSVRDKPNLAQLLAWQTGQAIFENTQLTEAVQEMNRYSTQKLEVGDVRAGSLRVSGAYRVGDNNAFARSVSGLLPVAMRQESDHIILESTEEVGKTSP